MYLAFSISFLVLFFFYRAQYTVSKSIFPLNEIEDGWSNCIPITTLVNYYVELQSGVYYYSNKSASSIATLSITVPDAYFNSFEACMNQLNQPQQICDSSNICLLNQANAVISLCNGDILLPNSGCIQSCAKNNVQIGFGNTDNSLSTVFPTVNDYSYYCNQNYNETAVNYACQQIYDSENPYNCSQKNYNNFITSVSLAFSSSLLIFQILLRISILIMKRVYKTNIP